MLLTSTEIAPSDVLQIINDLNRDGPRRLQNPRGHSDPPFVDVNGDGHLAPVDALFVINALNDGVRSSYVLGETSATASERSVQIGLGQDHGSRIYSFAVDAAFDTSDDSTAGEDRLEVYLVDPTNADRTLLDGGQPGTPFFVMEGEAASYPQETVHFDGSQVTLDLSSLANQSEGELRFELRNNDSGSQVTIRPLSNDIVEGVLVAEFPELPGEDPLPLTLHASWLSGSGGFQEIGFIVFDDQNGSVDGVRPGTPAYAQAVRNSPFRKTLFTDQDAPTAQVALDYSSRVYSTLRYFTLHVSLVCSGIS